MLCGLALLYLMMNLIGKCRIAQQTYTVADARIQGDVRIALVTDLHSSPYGAKNERLLEAIDASKPDIVLLGGDIFHSSGKNRGAEAFLDDIGKRYPCYYVLGNHEFSTKKVQQIRTLSADAGVRILSGDRVPVTVNGTTFLLCGIDDAKAGQFQQRAQLDQAAPKDDALFSVLLLHRPYPFATYFQRGFDLMLSGHAHGGQVRVPGLVNGLLAPQQGFFPKYAGGRYDMGGQTLIVSRGLSKRPYLVPRVCNPPELVLVTLTAA